MRKRFLAMALALAMVLSLAIPAYAADSDGRLDKEPEHEDQLIFGNDDEVGWGQSDITLQITEAAAPCDHDFQYTDNGDGTHNGVCSKCGQTITNERHIDNDDHLDCDKCGAKVECTGHYFRYEENEGGKTHKKICTSPNHDEHVLVAEEAHTLVEGACIKCGYKTECTHESHEIISDGKGNHSYRCTVEGGCGSVYKTEKCTDGDDDLFCDVEGCGYKFPCPHSGSDWLAENITSWTTNSDGTHYATCPHANCGETITQDCKSADGDCICDAPGCGYQGCHDYKWIDDENDKTHTWHCGRCDSEGTPPAGHERQEKHADANSDGLCDACGASMANVGVPVCVAEVPAEIPISATTDGVVTLPSNLWIENKSSRALRVSSVGLALDNRWNGVSISEDFASKTTGSKDIGFSLRGDDLTKPSAGSFDGNNWIIGAGDQLPLNPACRIAKQSATMEVATLGYVRFQLMWCEDADAVTSEKSAGASDQGDYNTGLDDHSVTLTVANVENCSVSVTSIRTDKAGIVVQLPSVTPDPGYVFLRWMTPDYKVVGVGTKLSADTTIIPAVKAVSSGTITFDGSRLSSYPEAKIEPATLQTDESGYLTRLPIVTGLPDNIRVRGWETSAGWEISVGENFNGDNTLYPILEVNTIDSTKLKSALNGFTGGLTLSKTAATSGTDVSSFGDGSMRLAVNGSTATLTGKDLRLPDNSTSLFSKTTITGITLDASVDTSNVTSISQMFWDCKQLATINLENMDTSNITDMSHLFSGCSALSDVSTLGAWDTSSVTNMTRMFSGCTGLTVINLNKWSVGKVATAEYMFTGCSSTTTILIRAWNAPALKSIRDMFQGCAKLTKMDLSEFKAPALTDMARLFMGCTALSEVKFGIGIDTSGVTAMNDMFASCSSLSNIDLTNITISDDCDCSHMFDGIPNLSMVDCPAVDKLVEKGILTKQP